MTIEIFIVGGAVRDALLNNPIKDIDFVVVGSTPEEMLESGFKQVGADFPVFLDENGDEFALARTERKVGKGYHGFETIFDPSITLEDDLFRRDLTVNSLAVNQNDWNEFKQTKNVNLVIDPFSGLDDLKARILRHVSEAFADDPVRILRIARFAARYFAEFGFTIAKETDVLMNQMVENGEVDHLVPERVWAETEKALMEVSPHVFFLSLGDEVIKRVFPLFNNPDSYNSDFFIYGAIRNINLEQRLMLLTATHNVEDVERELNNLKVPKKLIDSCIKFNKVINSIMGVEDLNAEKIFKIIDKLNIWSWTVQFREMGILISLFNNKSMNIVFNILFMCLLAANKASFDMLTPEQKLTLKGKEIGNAINDLRQTIILNLMVSIRK